MNKQYHTFRIAIALLILLLVTCVIAYALVYNRLQALNAGIGLPIGLLMLLVMFIGIAFFYLISVNNDRIVKLNEKVEQLHAMLDQTQNAQRKGQNDKGEVEKEQGEDINQIISELMPQGGSSIEKQGEQLLTNIAHRFNIAQGTFHLLNPDDDLFHLCSSYAYYTEGQPLTYRMGETLPGQVAKNQQLLRLEKLPTGYIAIKSGLGQAAPSNLIIAPVIDPQGKSVGILEISLFKAIPPHIAEPLFAQLGKRFGQLIAAAPRNTEQA